MKRLDQLWEVLRAAEARPFAYGRHDCVLLVARALDAMTGSSYARQIRRHYRDKHRALQLMACPGNLEALVSSYLGEPVAPLLACRGDVVACTVRDGTAIGVCVGERIAVAAAPVGVLYLPLAQAFCAWRVE